MINQNIKLIGTWLALAAIIAAAQPMLANTVNCYWTITGPTCLDSYTVGGAGPSHSVTCNGSTSSVNTTVDGAQTQITFESRAQGYCTTQFLGMCQIFLSFTNPCTGQTESTQKDSTLSHVSSAGNSCPPAPGNSCS